MLFYSRQILNNVYYKRMKIFVKNNDISKALRVLKKKLQTEGDLNLLRGKQHFVSAGETRRLDKKAGERRWRKTRAAFVDNIEKREQQLIKQNRRRAQKERAERLARQAKRYNK